MNEHFVSATSLPDFILCSPFTNKEEGFLMPNYRTKPRQITEQNRAKLPNKTAPNYRIYKNVLIFVFVNKFLVDDKNRSYD